MSTVDSAAPTDSTKKGEGDQPADTSNQPPQGNQPDPDSNSQPRGEDREKKKENDKQKEGDDKQKEEDDKQKEEDDKKKGKDDKKEDIKDKNGKESNNDEPKTESFRLKVFNLEPTGASPQDEESENDKDGDGEGDEEDPPPKPLAGAAEGVNKAKPSLPPNAKPVTTVEYKNVTRAVFEETSLADVRKKIASVMKDSFRFCDESGAISQDGRTLSSYIKELKGGEIKPDALINVYVTSFTRPKTSVATILDNPPFILKFVQKLEGDENQKESTLQSSSLPNVEGGKIKLKEIRKYVKAMSASSSRHQFCLEDGHTVDDETSLKDYVSSLSTTVDSDETPQATPSIEIYFAKPGAIKKSRRKGASEELKAMPALKLEKEDLKTLEEFNAKRDKELREVKEQLDLASFKLDDKVDNAKAAGALTEDEWAMVIRNCNLMYGWVVDSHNNQVVRAAKPAFRLRNGLNMDGTPAEPEEPPADINPSGEPSAGDSDKPAQPPPKISAALKARGVPHFAVNDDSGVEVTMASHEFQESMAKAHFSSLSVEAEISGGFGAYSAGVSGSYNQESTDNESSSKQTNEKTMIGTYRFPRATVHLTPNDLEPTPELEAAIKRIRTRKNVMDLRQLHKDYGHLFCRKVVIGGCLQSTKTFTMSTETSEKSARSQFKASVGAAFQTPYVSGSVKVSGGKGDASDEGSTKTDTQEKVVFEATGGNTILVSDPKAWTVSLANHENWRVIEQDGLSSLADAISEMRGYHDAPMWFMQAVPLLSKYIQIPRSRTLNVRLKAVLNEQVRERLLGNDGHKYLGHDNTKVLEYVQNVLKLREGAKASSYVAPRPENGRVVLDMTSFTEVVRDTAGQPLFSPKSVQCPVLMSYNGILGLEGAKRIDHSLVASIKIAKEQVANAQVAKARYDHLQRAQTDVNKMFKDGSFTSWLKLLEDYVKDLSAAQLEADKLKKAQDDLQDAEDKLKEMKDNNEQAIKKFSAEFKNTVWRLEVPDGGVLAHEARVSVRSLAVEPNPTLSVYRNAQGVYLTTMSSYDGPCFWRILKTDPFSREGDPIRDGDDIRLCWRFSDQGDGFRDFHDDTFGRRRFTKPDETGEVLYLKVPYPPILSSPSDIGLVLSSAKTRDPVVEKFKTLPRGSETNYNLHDLSLRIDSAGDNAMGESMDYMAPIIESQKQNGDISWGEDRPQFSPAALFVGSILLPGINGPVAGAMLRALFL